MKTKVFLVFSLLVNLALVAALLIGEHPPREEAAAPPAPIPGLPPAAPPPDVVVVTNHSKTVSDWHQVESADYKQYIANLRAIGCPEETIKDIILADVNKLFDARRKALKPPGERFAYWKSGAAATRGPDEERINQLQALAKEKRDLIKALLGVDITDPQDALLTMTSQFTEMLDFLPPDRQAQLLELEQRYAAKMAKFSGQTNEAALASLRTLRAEKEAEMLQLLSPQEREMYELTTSRTASTMRNQLGDFNPTEQEFRDIYAARKKLDEEYRRFSDTKDPASRDGREAALLQAYDDIHKSLGDARWNDYRLQREWMPTSPLRLIAEAENIPISEALKVPDIRDAYRREMQRLNANPGLSSEQREVARRQAQEATLAEIARILGPNGTKSFLANNTTKTWIR